MYQVWRRSRHSPSRAVRDHAPDASPGCTRFRLELVREATREGLTLPAVATPAALAVFLHDLLAAEPAEVFGALYFDVRFRPIGYATPFRGVLTSVNWAPAGFFAPALLANADSLVLFHNHPSGDPTPSEHDLSATKEIALAGRCLRIAVRDHLILGTPPRWTSLAAQLGLPSLYAEEAAFLLSLTRASVGDLELPRVDGRTRVLPKYRDPEDPRLTWAGRGCRPKWLDARLRAGAALEDFRVPPPADSLETPPAPLFDPATKE